MSKELRKLVRDGKVAVLYSPGFGAGWFSWNNDCEQCLFEPEIVEMVEAKRHAEIAAVAQRLYSNGGEDHFCDLGAHKLAVKWLPEGTLFRIDEYDGSESIKERNGEDWKVA